MMEDIVSKDPLLEPTPDGVDITNTFIRKALLGNHVIRTRPKGIPDPNMKDCLSVVHKIRGLIVQELESFDPTAFNREIRLQWEFVQKEGSSPWVVNGHDNERQVVVERTDMKTLHYHGDFIRDLLFAKDDVFEDILLTKTKKKTIRLVVVFGDDDDNDDIDDDDSDDED